MSSGFFRAVLMHLIFYFTDDKSRLCVSPDGPFQELVANTTGTENQNEPGDPTANTRKDTRMY